MLNYSVAELRSKNKRREDFISGRECRFESAISRGNNVRWSRLLGKKGYLGKISV